MLSKFKIYIYKVLFAVDERNCLGLPLRGEGIPTYMYESDEILWA